MGFYKILFYGGIVCAVIFLILTIVLFFVLKIPAVFGNLSGSTQRKRIEEIRKSGYESVSKNKAIHDSTSKITVREAEMKSADSGKLEEEKKEEKKSNKPKYTPRPDVGFGNINDDTATEILGYGKNGEEAAKSGAADAVDDDSTEVLREDTFGSAEAPDEETTDVLRGNTGSLRRDDPKVNEEETAILGSEGGESDDLFDDDLDEDVTDVLAGKSIEVEDISSKVTGSYGEDITSVLTSNDRTDIVNDMGSSIGSTDEMTSEEEDNTDYMDMVTVIYSATVVNTGESLDD
ncbi:MAG: hypothetical protein IJJ74_00205 [Eubacterium sp.]|nr:hypothetical protein [Eubacterium sp.]